MIDSPKLLADLQREVIRLHADLRARCDADPAVDAPLATQYEAARQGLNPRTALTYKAWREEELTNVAVAWVLACVFIRFLEDNALVETLGLAGPDAAGLTRARDQQIVFFRANPGASEREYLEHVFHEIGRLPGMADLFDRRHNPLWTVGPTGDAARAFLEFWRKADAGTGRPVHDFADPDWNSRFLGDLYQDLSEAARKRYALLQTPVFIEQFILDRTLDPAIETFGFRVVRMIDPTCGSGHFLLGSLARLHALWLEAEPGAVPAVLAQHALDQVYGVDLNPNVVAIARFRLLLAALRLTGTAKLRDAYDFKIHVAAGDALLHGRRFRDFEGVSTARTFNTEEIFRDELAHHYEAEDLEALHRILGQQYHAVVGNPPYITVKDRALSELYRARYGSCSGKYSLSVPFMERFFDLAIKGDGTPREPAGFVGQITANSFMKREFGKKLIETFLPRWDLTHVLDTSGAYIPGHGTPTVILFGRNQPPVTGTIRTVLGIRGEPATPPEPALGVVWQAIFRQIDKAGSESEWVSSADSPRANFHRHPWSIGGGGAAELKEDLDSACERTVWSFVEIKRKKPNIGFASFTGLDEAFLSDSASLARAGVERPYRRDLITGDIVRDWTIAIEDAALVPCDASFAVVPWNADSGWGRYLWPNRTALRNIESFEKTREEEGSAWWGWYRWIPEKYRRPVSITYAEVATHNHFVMDRGGRVFKQTAPVLKLSSDISEDELFALLGFLNSSTASFWLKQVCQPKGTVTGDISSEKGRPEANRFAFNASAIAKLPVPDFALRVGAYTTDLGRRLDSVGTALSEVAPGMILEKWFAADANPTALPEEMSLGAAEHEKLFAHAVFLQEELDWTTYAVWGVCGENELTSLSALDTGVGIEPHCRPFRWQSDTAPPQLPKALVSAYERRRGILKEGSIKLIENEICKRPWLGRQGVYGSAPSSYKDKTIEAFKGWLLMRLEGYFQGGQRVCELKDGFSPAAASFAPATRPAFTTTNQLAEIAQTDAAFLAVAEALQGGPGFSVPKLVRELVESASVPNLPAQRYKTGGLLKRHDWEHVWDLQRREDAIDAAEKVDEPGIPDLERNRRQLAAAARKRAELGDIPVPPKYASADFKKSVWWSLRGKLDVPKERWIAYPGAERAEDPSPVIAWAGWDHAQQARALAEYYVDAKQTFGFPPEKLTLLLAGLRELQPWLDQWHGEVDPQFGASPAGAIRGFVESECQALGVTREDLERVRMST